VKNRIHAGLGSNPVVLPLGTHLLSSTLVPGIAFSTKVTVPEGSLGPYPRGPQSPVGKVIAKTSISGLAEWHKW
jgi:hypothetical protein